MSKVLIIAPHPDDETLGCGGAMLRHIAQGDEVYWWIATSMHVGDNYSASDLEKRDEVIDRVTREYKFSSVIQAGWETGTLCSSMMGVIIRSLSGVFEEIQPDTVYAPFFNDVHSDHRLIGRAVEACGKSFRSPWVKKIRLYETLSETEQTFQALGPVFAPNTFVDISEQLEEKIRILKLYESELGQWPFPRCETAVRAQAAFRGLSACVPAAEAFLTVREII